MQIVIVLALAAAWLGAMWLGFVFVFPVVFPLTLVAATGGVLGYYYLHACRTLVPAAVDGPSPVEVPPPADPPVIHRRRARAARTQMTPPA